MNMFSVFSCTGWGATVNSVRSQRRQETEGTVATSASNFSERPAVAAVDAPRPPIQILKTVDHVLKDVNADIFAAVDETKVAVEEGLVDPLSRIKLPESIGIFTNPISAELKGNCLEFSKSTTLDNFLRTVLRIQALKVRTMAPGTLRATEFQRYSRFLQDFNELREQVNDFREQAESHNKFIDELEFAVKKLGSLDPGGCIKDSSLGSSSTQFLLDQGIITTASLVSVSDGPNSVVFMATYRLAQNDKFNELVRSLQTGGRAVRP